MWSPSPPGVPNNLVGNVPPIEIPLRYRYEETLDEDGLRAVVKAYDTRLRTDVAIKIIHHALRERDKSRYDELVARLQREAVAGNRPEVRGSPSIITVYDHIVDEAGNVLLTLQFASGGTLRDRLNKGPLPIAEALRLMSDSARGLMALHTAHIVHGEVKPSNIFLTADGRGRIGDLGKARIVGDEREALLRSKRWPEQDSHPGNPTYFSPEQMNGGGLVTTATDQYSLGTVAFELLTGKRYRELDTGQRETLLRTQSHEIVTLIKKMTAERPADRYPRMEAVIEAIEAAKQRRRSR